MESQVSKRNISEPTSQENRNPFYSVLINWFSIINRYRFVDIKSIRECTELTKLLVRHST